MNDILEDFSWHSAVGIDSALDSQRLVTRLPRSRKAMMMFEASGNDLLIHKTTRCLWRKSEDGKHIEPVFGNDVLTDDEVTEAMKEA
jgi:hypothetical protein